MNKEVQFTSKMELGVSIYYLQKALKYYERDLEKTTLKAKKPRKR